MERMEVEPCACAAAGGGALRRSNSAPMITSVSDGSAVFGCSSSARFRRSSVSVNPSGPSQLTRRTYVPQHQNLGRIWAHVTLSGLLPLSMFALSNRTEAKIHEETVGSVLRGSLQRLSSSSLTSTPAASHWGHAHHATNTWSPTHDSGVTPNSSPSPTRRFRPSVRWPPVVPLKRKGGVESDGPPKKLFIAGVSEPHRNFSVSLSSEASDSPPCSAPPSFSFSPHQH